MFRYFVLILLLGIGFKASAGNSCVVLLYHHFSDKTPKSTSISPQLFEQHLRYLTQNKFNVLPLDIMLNRLKNNNLPSKCVSLTADDAYISIYQNALPLLKKYQMSLAVFASTDAIDKKYSAMMDWQKMREIQGENVTFFNHSKSHTSFFELEKMQVNNEIIHAQNRLKNELKIKQKILAYPYGEADIEHYQQAQDLGYIAFGQHSGAVSVDSDLQNLPRFPMASNFAKMPSFILKINTKKMPLKPQRISPLLGADLTPILTLIFKRPMTKNEQHNFMCFVSGGDVKISWINTQTVKIKAKKPLSNRRSRYNCTLPAGKKGIFYWHSVQWVNAKIGQ